MLSYVQQIPIYTIQCGAITETIDEQTFENLKNQLLDKKKQLDKTIYDERVNMAKETIDKRFNEINVTFNP